MRNDAEGFIAKFDFSKCTPPKAVFTATFAQETGASSTTTPITPTK